MRILVWIIARKNVCTLVYIDITKKPFWGSEELIFCNPQYTWSIFYVIDMKPPYFLFTSLLLLSACTTSEIRISQNTNPPSLGTGAIVGPYEIGSVDTAFKFLWPDHRIEVGGVPDSKVGGVTCFYSRAKKWGITWAIGIAEDTSDASVSCRQTGVITFLSPIKPVEEIWNESTSFFFKKLRIVRFYDARSNSLIYLVYSDRLIDGSPKNSISAVALDQVKPLLQQ